MTTISWLIAVLVLIVAVVAMFIGRLDTIVGSLIAGLAVVDLLSGYANTTFVRRA